MDGSFIVNIGLVVVAMATYVWGVAVFRGRIRWFRLLAGGGDFLDLNPDPETFRKAARQPGVVICLLVVLFACLCAWQFAPHFGAPEFIVALLERACIFAGVVFGIVAVVVFVLQLRTHMRLLRDRK